MPPKHFKSIEAWTEFKKRILKEKLIDKQHLSIIEKEKIHWTNVLNRILSVIHYLAAHNDAFRGSSDVLYTKMFTIKQWSETRWESRINSVKALRFQLSSILNALEEVSETANDLMARSEAVSLSNEIGNYEFILSLVIWYDILTEVNIVSKSTQDHNMDINTSVKMVQRLIQFFQQYRENGFNLAKIVATKLAEDADIAVAFKNPRTYSDNFGFLHRIGKLKTMKNDDVLRHCKDLQLILTDNDLKDIDGLDLFSELIIFRSLIDEDTNSLQALNILKTTNGSFPNLTIDLRIMLTIPVTSACAERSFSKLKLIKTYLRNRLDQDKLSELALISIEEEIEINMAVKDSVGGFKDNAHVYRTPKACSSVKMFLGTYVKSVMETFGRQNLICPFAVGCYKTSGIKLDTKFYKNLPKQFFYGTYKFHLQFIKNKVIYGCITSIVEVIRPWETD
ncbi:hypothetical protein QTP88_002885 [Uroleucon formosanum]